MTEKDREIQELKRQLAIMREEMATLRVRHYEDLSEISSLRRKLSALYEEQENSASKRRKRRHD